MFSNRKSWKKMPGYKKSLNAKAKHTLIQLFTKSIPVSGLSMKAQNMSSRTKNRLLRLLYTSPILAE